MTIRRVGDTVLLEDVCAIEDAETLMQQLEVGAALIDWSGCTHLHTACLQVLMAARVPMSGAPVNEAAARWLTPILSFDTAPAASNTAATDSTPIPTQDPTPDLTMVAPQPATARQMEA